MSTFQVIGTELVDPEEMSIKRFSGELASFHNVNLSASKKSMSFTGGQLPVNELKDLRRDFTPIGIGKPLSIEIATVYSGEYRKFLGGKKDVIVVSGVKNAQTFQATSRAINIKKENVAENAFLEFTAFEDGTKIVYYTPAMDADSMIVSFEIMFDNFDTKIFEAVSGLLNSGAGLPVFLPAAPYLLGGSQLVNIGARLGDTLFSGHPNLSESIAIQFQSPVIPPTEPREFVVFNEKDRKEFESLKAALVDVGGNPCLRLVNKTTTAEYKGPAPYIIVLLDGAKRESLESFAPTIASAAVIKKFYGAQDRTGEITGVLQEAMQLYNDSNYRTKGEKIKKQLDTMQKDSEEYKKLKTLYDAYAANIRDEHFKLGEIG